MNNKEIKELVNQDLIQVSNYIKSNLVSDIKLIQEVVAYMGQSKGKLVRPSIMSLIYHCIKDKTLDLTVQEKNYQDFIKLASASELIHNATLLHDDVVDDSSMRRGLKTVKEKFSNPAAVLVGDFIYTKAFQILASLENSSIMQAYTDAINLISEGEVMQLENLGDTSIDINRYNDVIYRKTATLFEVSATVVATLLYPENKQLELEAKNYGKNLGLSFQIFDDIIDYQSDVSKMGKNPGDDLAEGKATLPLLHLREYGSPEDKELVNNIILQNVGREAFSLVKMRVIDNQSLQYCLKEIIAIKEQAQEALKNWPDCIEKQALLAIIKTTY